MTLREWIPQWLKAYKFGTIKERSYHQLELLVLRLPDDLLDMELADIKPLDLSIFKPVICSSISLTEILFNSSRLTSFVPIFKEFIPVAKNHSQAFIQEAAALCLQLFRYVVEAFRDGACDAG